MRTGFIAIRAHPSLGPAVKKTKLVEDPRHHYLFPGQAVEMEIGEAVDLAEKLPFLEVINRLNPDKHEVRPILYESEAEALFKNPTKKWTEADARRHLRRIEVAKKKSAEDRAAKQKALEAEAEAKSAAQAQSKAVGDAQAKAAIAKAEAEAEQAKAAALKAQAEQAEARARIKAAEGDDGAKAEKPAKPKKPKSKPAEVHPGG